MRVAVNEKQSRKLIAKPNFKSFKIVNENLTLVTLSKTEVCLDKPISVGCAILDIAKLIMYRWHYDYFQNKYGRASKLLFTDTDSLCYHVTCPDIYHDIKTDMLEHYDTSDFPKDHKCYSEINKKRLGSFKDETAGVPIVEFVGLRSKMYSILLADGSSKHTAKGIQHHFAKQNLKHELYKKCLEDQIKTFAEYKSIRSFSHELYTIQEKKVALCSFDDKRYLLEDSHDTLAYGHYRIPKK